MYAWCIERVEDREQFDAALDAPLVGRKVDDGGEAARAELEAFAAFAAQSGSSVAP